MCRRLGIVLARIFEGPESMWNVECGILPVFVESLPLFLLDRQLKMRKLKTIATHLASLYKSCLWLIVIVPYPHVSTRTNMLSISFAMI